MLCATLVTEAQAQEMLTQPSTLPLLWTLLLFSSGKMNVYEIRFYSFQKVQKLKGIELSFVRKQTLNMTNLPFPKHYSPC